MGLQGIVARDRIGDEDMINGELVIDFFACGGGASVGIEEAFGKQVDIAVNHNMKAILMHMTNHPDTEHVVEDIFAADIKSRLKGRKVAFLWASPDCTSHSKAASRKPKVHNNRILPMAVYKQCKAIAEEVGEPPETIIMENVPEIMKWAPLDEQGYPIKEREGECYQCFLRHMKLLGYRYESKVLNSADFGAHTSRVRWYMVMQLKDKPIVFPKQTHDKSGNHGLKKYRPCYECLDFTDLGLSIFARKRPLAEKTCLRIANGIMKFVVNNPNRYIIPDKFALPFLIQYHSETRKGDCRGQAVTEPIQTLDTSNRYGLVTAFITKFYNNGTGHEVTEPLHTITTSAGHFGLVSCFLLKYYGNGGSVGVNKPLDTLTTKDRFGLVSVVINGESYMISDIRLRMLKPEEQKLCQEFPEDYIIDHDLYGNPYPIAQQVHNIGNSVVPLMAKLLAESNRPDLIVAERTPNMRITAEQTGQLRFA